MELTKITGVIEGDFVLIYDYPHEIHEKTGLHKSYKGNNHYTHPDNVWCVGFPKHATPRYKALLNSVGYDLTISE